MAGSSPDDARDALQAYAAGELGTRAAIDRLGLKDYADLVIALGQHDLDVPRPEDSPAREARMTRASVILQPRLRNAP